MCPRSSHPAHAILASLVWLAVACGGGDSPPENMPSAVEADKLSGIGDSIMQGFDAKCTTLVCPDQIEYSFAQGTDAAVDSLYSRYKVASGLPGDREFVSVSGAEMIGDAVAQADAICKQQVKPNRIVLLLGGNDVCGASSVDTLPTVADFRTALKAALDKLAAAGCGLPAGSWVHVLSMPRVDLLRQAGLDLNAFVCSLIWRNFVYPICAVVTGDGVTQSDLDAIGDRIDQYNAGIAAEVDAANKTYAAGGLQVSTDWRGTAPNSSIGTFVFGAGDISSTDCFHPSFEGQRKLACAAWESWEGSGNVASCLR